MEILIFAHYKTDLNNPSTAGDHLRAWHASNASPDTGDRKIFGDDVLTFNNAIVAGMQHTREPTTEQRSIIQEIGIALQKWSLICLDEDKIRTIKAS